MTDVPATVSGEKCNGDRPPENGQQLTSKISKQMTDVDGTLPYYRVEPSLEDLPMKGKQEESGKPQGTILPNWPMDKKILKGKVFSFLFICLF
jgi:hypothetical protein